MALELSYQSTENRKGGVLYFNLAKIIVHVHGTEKLTSQLFNWYKGSIINDFTQIWTF